MTSHCNTSYCAGFNTVALSGGITTVLFYYFLGIAPKNNLKVKNFLRLHFLMLALKNLAHLLP